MKLLGFISKIFEPATKLVDDLHTSDEERLQLKTELLNIQTSVIDRALDLEKTNQEVRGEIIKTEAKADSWFTKSWRPLVMLMLTGSVLAYWFGLTPTDPSTGLSTIPLEIVNRMYSLVQIGVGGYIGGRSAEKIVPKVVEALKSKEET